MKQRTIHRRVTTLIATVATAIAGVAAVVVGLTPTANAATTAGCGQTPTLTSGTRTITSGGQSRSYILRIPSNYNNRHPYRLIIAYHWLSATAANVANGVAYGNSGGYIKPYYGLQELAGESTIFVAPQGLNNGWSNSNGADVTLTDNILTQVENALCVDTTQRFAMGFSYGGAMSYALACARPTVFRAVAVYSGGQLSGCSGGTQAVAYLGAHGIRDAVLNISGGRTMRNKFVTNNHCASANPPEPASGSRTHTSYTYSGCDAGKPVAWYAFDEDHTPVPPDADGSQWLPQVTWNFFTQFQSAPPTGTPSATASPTPSPSTSPTAGQRIVGTGSSRCVNITGQSTADGTRLEIRDCATQWSQLWTLANGAFKNPQSGKCMNATGTGNGSSVTLATCNASTAQQWQVQPNGNITNVGSSGKCLDVIGQATANGSRLQIYTCVSGGQNNQRWTVQ